MKGTRRLRARIPVSIGFSYESLQREYPTPLMSFDNIDKGSSPRTQYTKFYTRAHKCTYVFAYNYTTADGGK